MNTPVRVINCGSSSIKYALIDGNPQGPGTMMPKREEVDSLFSKLS